MAIEVCNLSFSSLSTEPPKARVTPGLRSRNGAQLTGLSKDAALDKKSSKDFDNFGHQMQATSLEDQLEIATSLLRKRQLHITAHA